MKWTLEHLYRIKHHHHQDKAWAYNLMLHNRIGIEPHMTFPSVNAEAIQPFRTCILLFMNRPNSIHLPCVMSPRTIFPSSFFISAEKESALLWDDPSKTQLSNLFFFRYFLKSYSCFDVEWWHLANGISAPPAITSPSLSSPCTYESISDRPRAQVEGNGARLSRRVARSVRSHHEPMNTNLMGAEQSEQPPPKFFL